MPDSQQPISPIGFLFWKLPPPPYAVLLVLLATSSQRSIVCETMWLWGQWRSKRSIRREGKRCAKTCSSENLSKIAQTCPTRFRSATPIPIWLFEPAVPSGSNYLGLTHDTSEFNHVALNMRIELGTLRLWVAACCYYMIRMFYRNGYNDFNQVQSKKVNPNTHYPAPWWPGKWHNGSHWLFLAPWSTSTSYIQHAAAWSNAKFLYHGTMLHGLQLQTHPKRGPTVCRGRGFETMSSANPSNPANPGLDKHLHAQKRILHDRLLIAFTVNIYIYISDFLLIPMSHWIYIYTTLTSTHLIYISSTKKGLGFKGLTYDRFVFLQIFFVIKVNYNESIYYI